MATATQSTEDTPLSTLPRVVVARGWLPIPSAYVNVGVAGIAYIPLPRVAVPPGWPQVPPAAVVELTYPPGLIAAR